MAKVLSPLGSEVTVARTVGIADGAASNWAFLDQHTERQLIDFFHVSQTIGKLAQAHWPKRGSEQKRAA